jgi:large subunit ribosomal protein L20
MTRVTRGFVAKRRHKKIANKTFCSSINGGFRLLKQKYMKSGISSYIDRRKKKREFRRLWITRINAFLRSRERTQNDIPSSFTYSKFIHCLKKNKIVLNRKVVSQLACIEPNTLHTITLYTSLNLS